MNIAYLADHKEVIPVLAQWFYKEWAYLHPGKTLADVEQFIGERINTNKIPLALVVFDNQELIGTVCLKVHDMDTHLDLSPWLAGLYVSAPIRRAIVFSCRGIAAHWRHIHCHLSRLHITPRWGWALYPRKE